jgi:hypothetical protein
MNSKLEHRVNAIAELRFEFLERRQVPGIDDQGFLTNCVRPYPQRQPAMGIVQVIGRTDCQVLNSAFPLAAPQLLEVAVKSLELGEKLGAGEKLIENPYGIMRVGGGDHDISGVPDGLQVAGCDVSCHPSNRKVCRHRRDVMLPSHRCAGKNLR